jgi:DNA-directed RNA polymerase subunit RPC12/RpoP
MIRYVCPKCKKALTANDADAGAQIACPQCSQRLHVPKSTKTMLGMAGPSSGSAPASALPSEGYAGSPPPASRPEPPSAPEKPERNEIDYPPERKDFLKSPAVFIVVFSGVVFLLAVWFYALVTISMFHR